MVDPTKTKTLDIQFLEKFKTKFKIDLHGLDQTISKTEVPHFFEDETDESEGPENTSDDGVDNDMEEFEVAAIVGDNIVSQPIDNYLNPIKPKFILNLGTPFKSRDKLLKDLFCTTSKVGINC